MAGTYDTISARLEKILRDFTERNPRSSGKPMPMSKVAELLGVKYETLRSNFAGTRPDPELVARACELTGADIYWVIRGWTAQLSAVAEEHEGYERKMEIEVEMPFDVKAGERVTLRFVRKGPAKRDGL